MRNLAAAANRVFARVYQRRSMFAPAQTYYTQAFGLVRGALGDRHPALVPLFLDLTSWHVAQEQLQEGLVTAQQALELAQTVFGKEHRDTCAAAAWVKVLTARLGQKSSPPHSGN